MENSNSLCDPNEYFKRQQNALGKVAMKRLRQFQVLVQNQNAVGSEVSKNIALSSASLLTIMDEEIIAEKDLERTLFFKHTDIGKKRATVMREAQTQMSPFIKITEDTYGSLNDDFIKVIFFYLILKKAL